MGDDSGGKYNWNTRMEIAKGAVIAIPARA
jgi:hypothetical protein